MRTKDFFQMVGMSLAIAFLLSIITYFLRDNSTGTSFLISFIIFFILSTPIGYWAAKKNSTCSQCGKAFSISKNGQTDLENFVKYKNETVTENGVSKKKDVPYNVRRYIQHLICDSCHHKSQYETQEEKRA